MSSDVAIKIDHVSKNYHIYDKPIDRLKQSLFRGKKLFYKVFTAMDDVSFEIKKGETVGIIGRNGSGKSTLLQMICGTLTPTSGEISLDGRVAALLELGAGFNPEFTGRENVYMNASILGLSKQEIDNKFDEIASYAEIGEHIDQPVKTYSSGMYVRLAFSVAINVKPDILIVDEALSVGDIAFQAKCMTTIKNMQKNGVTVLFVSHDTGTVKSLCSRGVYLENGRIKMIGMAGEVAERYVREMREQMNESTGSQMLDREKESIVDEDSIQETVDKPKIEFKKSDAFEESMKDFRYGKGGARVTFVEMLDSEGAEVAEACFGQHVQIKVYFESSIDVLVGLSYYILDDKKNLILGAGPRQLLSPFLPAKAHSRYVVTYRTSLPLQEGAYSIQVQLNSPVVEGESAEYLDVIDNAIVFSVARKEPVRIWSKVYVDNEMEVVSV